MSSLPTPLRRQLENAVKQARTVAAAGARKALEALAVHEPEPYAYMDEAQTELRRKLRAQAKQLGDREKLATPGACEIKHLIEKLAYDQWHRLLFARYLVENNLLISPEHRVAVSLGDCEELAPSLQLKDAWAVAARFAAKELPEIFRADDPAGAVELPAENRKPLIQLVIGLPVEVFTASDSLGWCYQFWQAERKDEVNAAGNKIGADELPAVTQLFTEDYMVDFLLDNTLGAWHAGKVLAAKPVIAESAQSEEELRAAVALPGCPWSYLRFIKVDNGKWTPAAGTFEDWPKAAKEVTCLDPCMGSGHFVVAIFERMVALRIAEETLDEAVAAARVIGENLFGLEIDPRCTQIAAFNLALAAWRRVGHCELPAMNLACSGLAPNARREDWLKLAGKDERLRNGMERLYRLFEDAPILGSLIDPNAAEGDLLVAAFHSLQPLLELALESEKDGHDSHEMTVTARGLAKAAEILSGRFNLVATNVPYLGRGKQQGVLKDYCERFHREASADLATCFAERCLTFCAPSGSASFVTPHNWLFLPTYRKLRQTFLRNDQWKLVARLGARAFETISGEVVNVALLIITAAPPNKGSMMAGLDVAESKTPADKAARLLGGAPAPLQTMGQEDQFRNPDNVIAFGDAGDTALLNTLASTSHGQGSFDAPAFELMVWELSHVANGWVMRQSTTKSSQHFAGCYKVFRWENGEGQLAELMQAKEVEGYSSGKWRAGVSLWGNRGVLVNQMNNLSCSLYLGHSFDENTCVITPHDPSHLAAIWLFCTSESFENEVRRINQKVNVNTATLAKVPFDLADWLKLAAEKYPRGLPKPFSSDSTQWLFNGHPKGSDQPLQVAVARLLGYLWPRQTGSNFPDCPALGPDGLEKLADSDGILCLSATKGEPAAAERLRALLAVAWGERWSTTVQQELLAQVGYAGKTLDDWLRDGYFEQHCALFHHRPFIWHIWDGNKTGFSALVNYHQLNYGTLESLTYAYLGDWIRRQQAAVDAGEAGSDARLQAARQLQAKLKLILEGEPPYDLFVRWKPLSKQAIGWHPDVNDGVRMNIRPFATADILRKRVKIKWDKDRGKEPVREKNDFPWFWGWDGKTQDFVGVGEEPDGNRWNDCHYTNKVKREAQTAE